MGIIQIPLVRDNIRFQIVLCQFQSIAIDTVFIDIDRIARQSDHPFDDVLVPGMAFQALRIDGDDIPWEIPPSKNGLLFDKS